MFIVSPFEAKSCSSSDEENESVSFIAPPVPSSPCSEVSTSILDRTASEKKNTKCSEVNKERTYQRQ